MLGDEKKMKKRCLALVFAAAVVLSVMPVMAHGGASPKDRQYNFYIVSHGGAIDPFWGTVIKGMNDAARLVGVKATYLGPEKFSIKKMVDMLDSAIAAKPDGIVVTITNPAPLDEPLRRAIEQGIPVIAINVPDTRPEGERIPYLCYVGGDEYLSGVEVARRMLKDSTPRRAVVGIQEPGHVGLELRAEGFKDVMREKGIPVETLDITNDPIKAFGAFESYFAKHPDTDAIFTLGPLGNHPAIRFLEEKELVGKVMLAGFDLSPMTNDAIKSGKMVCTVEQQQYLQGYLPIIYLYLYNEHGLCPHGNVLTGPSIVDQSNVGIVEQSVKKGYR